jgi:Aspartyl protease
MGESVRLESIGSHVVRVPVRVGPTDTTWFLFDTGIGLDLVSDTLLARAGGTLTGEIYTGRRMSGQTLDVPLARVPSLNVGSLRIEEALVGVFDLALPPELGAVEGFLAPTFFGDHPFTLRRTAGTLSWEDSRGRTNSHFTGRSVPMQVRWDGPSVSLFVEVDLPDGSSARVEVDTGSNSLILHSRFMTALSVREGDPGVTKRQGTDETGHEFVRYLAPVRGHVSVRGQPELSQEDPVVMFQTIIYDGLLGDEFLRRYDLRFDLARSELCFAPPVR